MAETIVTSGGVRVIINDEIARKKPMDEQVRGYEQLTRQIWRIAAKGKVTDENKGE